MENSIYNVRSLNIKERSKKGRKMDMVRKSLIKDIISKESLKTENLLENAKFARKMEQSFQEMRLADILLGLL
jgi:hypothetical protein